MDNEHLLFELFEDLSFLGPGDDRYTRRAFSAIPGLPPQPRILDVGCGTGRQTLALARNSVCSITAVDIHEPFLRHLESRLRREGLGERITTVCRSMTELDFAPGSFDLIWSEGAVYLVGLARALREWKPLLARPGFFACTEVSWLKPDPPENLRVYWNEECEVVSIAENLAVIQREGYRCLEAFPLPPEAWWDNYYRPLSAKLPSFLESHQDEVGAVELVEEFTREIDMYRRYADYYGYVFYIMEANGALMC